MSDSYLHLLYNYTSVFVSLWCLILFFSISLVIMGSLCPHIDICILTNTAQNILIIIGSILLLMSIIFCIYNIVLMKRATRHNQFDENI